MSIKSKTFLVLIGFLPGLFLPHLPADATTLQAGLASNHIVLAQENEIKEVFIGQLAFSENEDNLNLQENSFLEQPLLPGQTGAKIIKKQLIMVTGYSSTPDQTDSTPFITASGSRVHDGVIAANFLKFDTKVQFPQIFGDKVFIVEDRMAIKNSHKIDIWFPNRRSALEFGIQKTEMIIL